MLPSRPPARDRKPLARIASDLLLATCLLLLLASRGFASAQELVLTEEDFAVEKVYSPFVGRDYPDRVLFGDTHFHTNLSFDAGLIGTTLTVDEGYRFARGEKVMSNSGQPAQLIRPLDFLRHQ